MPVHYTVTSQAPIAVFDSGLGGLTLVRSLRKSLPNEDIVYFGDTARVPYGSKSPETVTRFTREICHFLLHLQPKCILAACNTVSALALHQVEKEIPVPLLGVVDASAKRAAELSQSHIVAVIGTEATIASCAYERAIHRYDSHVRVIQQSCPLFVPLVEEGRIEDDPVLQLVIHDYLAPVKRLRPNVVLLGCTHYPLLRDGLQRYFGPEVTLIDSGDAVTEMVSDLLTQSNMLSVSQSRGTVQCYVSDFPQRFAAIGARFMGEPLPQVIRASAEAWHSSTKSKPAASA